MGTLPAAAVTSEWQTPLASTWMRTLVGPRSASVISSMTIGSLYACKTAALIGAPFRPDSPALVPSMVRTIPSRRLAGIETERHPPLGDRRAGAQEVDVGGAD